MSTAEPSSKEKVLAKRFNHYLGQMRDTLYRLEEELAPGDPVRRRLHELASEIEDQRQVLVNRCRECGRE